MQSVLKGTILTMAVRWMDRALGFVSMLILARLLVPSDFGLVSLAWVVVGLADVLFDFGGHIQLIQKKDPDREDFDTTWTLRLLMATTASALIWLCAPLAGEYYHDKRVVDILHVIAPSLMINAACNIGTVTWVKNMQFNLEFRFQFIRRITGFITTLSAVLILRDYWGLVIGSLTTQATGLILSYVLHSYRPKLCLTRARTLWRMSLWLLTRSVGMYANTQTDKILLGRVATAATVGSYTLADELATIPTTEILAPFARALVPAFAAQKDDHEKLGRTVLLATGIAGFIVLPTSVGLAHVSHLAVPILLGPKWNEAIPILEYLCYCSLALAFSSASTNMLLAVGKVRNLTLVVWSQTVLFIGLAVFAFPGAGVLGIAKSKLIAQIFGSGANIRSATDYVGPIRYRDFARWTWRPAVSVCAMKLVLTAIPPLFENHFLELGLLVLTGAAVYASSVVALWHIAGKPDGVESYLLEKLRSRKG